MSGDLRWYVWIQFMPLGVIMIFAALFKPDSIQSRFLLFALACYGLAKLLELFDRAVFNFYGGLISGHSLKHIAAAAACYSLVLMLKGKVQRE
jgi:hypothetical protein